MHVMRAALLVLALVLPTVGCIENMGDLKETLGYAEAAELVPLYEAPVARAHANVTSVLAGQPVRFTSEGSKDPQNLPLRYEWRFSDDARLEGPSVSRAFAQPGEHRVRLVVVNTADLFDEAVLTLQVLPTDRAPVAAFRVLGADGAEAQRVLAGAKVAFDASASADPEGTALDHEWDFGDGAASRQSAPTHAYERPGRYTVVLAVEDAGGLRGTAQRVVLVDLQQRLAGRVALAGDDVARHAVPVADGARLLELTLAFPGQLGANDLELVLLAADGREVARASAPTAPGDQAEQTRTLRLDADLLAREVPGAWTAEVRLVRGASVDYALDVRESM